MYGATGGASGSVHFSTGEAIDSTRMPRASTIARALSISASLRSMMFLPKTTRSSANVMPRSAIASSARSKSVGENSSVTAPMGMKRGREPFSHSPTFEKGTRPLSLITDRRLEARRQQMHHEQRQQIRRGRDDEHRHVAAGELEHVRRHLRDQHPADRPGRSAESDDRADRLLREHVRRERVDVGRPPLVRRCGQSDQPDGDPQIRRARRKHDRGDRQRADEHRRLTGGIHRPAALDQAWTTAILLRRCPRLRSDRSRRSAVPSS